MRLPFLDRTEELSRLAKMLSRPDGALAVLYGRRRCGKSRLVLEALGSSKAVYFAGDDRESTIQRTSLAREIARVLPGFDKVTYPDWDALFERWWSAAPRGAVLAIDELPALVSSAAEVPSILQRHLDRAGRHAPHLILAGSSQRMMHGLVLERSAPLFGRAREILRIAPLPAGYIRRALRLRGDEAAVEAFALWGGIPRYWELAAEFDTWQSAAESLVLSPLGVLYDEPAALLLDDLRDTTQAASILALIGQGAHRLSEIAGRLGKPATALSRPLQRLVDLDLVARETPFGAHGRDSKRSAYKIRDPFLRFWFRFVDPNRSRLESRQIAQTLAAVQATFVHHVAGVWEDLVRESVPRASYFDRSWGPAHRWWGAGLDRRPLEVDVLAESSDGKAILVGEVKWSDDFEPGRVRAELQAKAVQLPMVGGRQVELGVWLKASARGTRKPGVFGPREVLAVLV
jgi:AAA+ ATPase superfamily predicted ATPase